MQAHEERDKYQGTTLVVPSTLQERNSIWSAAAGVPKYRSPKEYRMCIGSINSARKAGETVVAQCVSAGKRRKNGDQAPSGATQLLLMKQGSFLD